VNGQPTSPWGGRVLPPATLGGGMATTQLPLRVARRSSHFLKKKINLNYKRITCFIILLVST